MYKIEKLERKTTSTGKTMIKATIKDNQGATTEGVAIWDSFPLFGSLKEGDVVEGDISTKVNGNYTNHTLNPSATGTPRYGQNKSNGGASRVEAEKVRNENIKKNMEWKAEGQAYGNSVTNAVNLTIELIKKGDITETGEIKESILYYRDFLLNESQKYQDKGMTKEERIESGEIPF